MADKKQEKNIYNFKLKAFSICIRITSLKKIFNFFDVDKEP